MTVRATGMLRAASVPDRTITYLLLPYGQPGRTSVGLVTAAAGTVDVPSVQEVVLNMEHDPLRPVGRMLSCEDTPDGMVATFRIVPTQAGTDLLVEASEGLRTGVSVELDRVRIKDGALLPGAQLVGAGAVTRPAFDDARTLLVASDTPDDTTPDDDDDSTPLPDDEDTPDDDSTPLPDDDDAREDTTVDDTTTLTAAAPVGAHPVTTQDRGMDLATVNRLLAQAGAGDRSPQLLAALSDLTHTANAHVQAPQFIGEAWSGSPYARQLVPLVASGTLTSYQVTGWRWKVAPVGADYSGDKADVPSNAATTEAVTFPAERWAGAHDVDRKFRDFGDEAFWSSYWAAMAASYGRWSDANVASGIKAAATATTPGSTTIVGTIVACALAVIPVGTPTFCLLGSTAFAHLAETDPLAFLSGNVSIPGGDGTVGGLAFRTHPDLAAGDVIVGTRNAATWYELSDAPIRVEAVDLVQGGVDVGAFGYGVLGVHDAKGLAKATFTPPVTP